MSLDLTQRVQIMIRDPEIGLCDALYFEPGNVPDEKELTRLAQERRDTYVAATAQKPDVDPAPSVKTPEAQRAESVETAKSTARALVQQMQDLVSQVESL